MPDNAPTAPTSQELAAQRTFLAAERTLFAALRTGLSIAGGGSLVITLLGAAWPAWVQLPLVVTFLVVGYAMTLMGLSRYRAILATVTHHLAGSAGPRTSVRVLAAGIVALQLAILVVVVLFLVQAFEIPAT
jgi:uncharacterized membrane protein YidH (DUF202 family)